MEIIKYDGNLPIEEAIKNNEPLMAVIFFDGKKAVVSHADEAVEHYILLMHVGYRGTEIDSCFRIVFDKDGADWTFICPSNYKNRTPLATRSSSTAERTLKRVGGCLHATCWSERSNPPIKEAADIPPRYKNISDKQRRIAEFYKDGFAVISEFLSDFGYFVDINIPKRYRRHFEELSK